MNDIFICDKVFKEMIMLILFFIDFINKEQV